MHVAWIFAKGSHEMLLCPQVRAVRQKCRAMEVNELPQDDKIRLDAAHQKRLREIVQKHCVKPLREAMAHVVRPPFCHVVGFLPGYILWISALGIMAWKY